MRGFHFRYVSMVMLVLLAACDTGSKTDLIPRQALFGAPERFQFRLSPDGTKMSFLAPIDGVLNIWVAPRGDFQSARALTKGSQGIYFHTWAANGHTILYRQDRTGSQNWRIYAIDIEAGRESDLTPFDGVQAGIVALSNAHPDDVLLSINRRDPRFADVFQANLRTGKIDLAIENPGFSRLIADNGLNIRFALAPTSAGGMTLYQRAGTGWAKVGEVPPEDALTFRILDFDATDKHVYMIDSRGRDTAALTRYTPSTGETEILGQGDKTDIASVLIHPTLRTVQAFTVNYQRREWKVIDPAVEDDLRALSVAAGAQGEFEIVDRTRDDSTWVVHVDRVTEPGAYYLYDTNTGDLTFLFATRPQLENAELVPMHTTLVKARDGLDLVAYYSLPSGADRNRDGRPERKSPMVLIVHGGPWGRDRYGLDEWHQWLANRGYAVLSVNFRGSTGFGKAFINAADRQWGEAMLHDLDDAAQWAAASGIAEPSKIAILGGHYGGYAALAGLAFTPTRYACGVSIGAPSNLVSMLKGMPPYWISMKDILLKRVGDPSTEVGMRLLEAQSPALHAAGISRPLLIAQGANDPVASESDTQSIVRTLKKSGVPITYVLYPDEGGILDRPANQLSFYAMAEAFLGKCLGGRTEPIGDALKGSSAQIIEGAEHIPGLIQAMAGVSSAEAIRK